MFTAALHTIPKTWQQPKCPSANEWIKKMWYILHVHTHTHTHTYIYTMDYYSVIKKRNSYHFE